MSSSLFSQPLLLAATLLFTLFFLFSFIRHGRQPLPTTFDAESIAFFDRCMTDCNQIATHPDFLQPLRDVDMASDERRALLRSAMDSVFDNISLFGENVDREMRAHFAPPENKHRALQNNLGQFLIGFEFEKVVAKIETQAMALLDEKLGNQFSPADRAKMQTRMLSFFAILQHNLPHLVRGPASAIDLSALSGLTFQYGQKNLLERRTVLDRLLDCFIGIAREHFVALQEDFLRPLRQASGDHLIHVIEEDLAINLEHIVDETGSSKLLEMAHNVLAVRPGYDPDRKLLRGAMKRVSVVTLLDTAEKFKTMAIELIEQKGDDQAAMKSALVSMFDRIVKRDEIEQKMTRYLDRF